MQIRVKPAHKNRGKVINIGDRTGSERRSGVEEIKDLQTNLGAYAEENRILKVQMLKIRSAFDGLTMAFNRAIEINDELLKMNALLVAGRAPADGECRIINFRKSRKDGEEE